MSNHSSLQQAYERSVYPVTGHRPRNLQVLKDALNQLDGHLESDIYGAGTLIEEFQAKMAAYLGKETAVFFPSGTMAQQIALRIWCDQLGVKRVAYHPLSHLEIHEEDGLKKLHGIEAVLLADKERIFTLEDVQSMDDEIACLLIELPQREIGGQLPEYGELVAISQHCRKKGIKLHLDGARLLEVLPYYQKTADEVCALFDSVYLSFYKGIGGIAGAILAGEEAFIKESKVWKRRHGGDLISLYPYILSADYYFQQRKDQFPRYFEDAKELAQYYNGCSSMATRPTVPVSNMFHVHVQMPKEKLEPLLLTVYEETGVALTHYLRDVDGTSCYFEVTIGDRYAQLPKEALKRTFHMLDELILQKETLSG